ncbi:MAG TPA: hypothetical protein VGA69_11145 [Nitriliruptorales bacterium]
MRTRRAIALAALTTALVTVGCGNDDPAPSASTSPSLDTGQAEEQIAVVTASYDLAVGPDQRVILGVLTPDQQLIGFGEVDVQVFFLGEQDASGSPEERGTATASWIPVPGMQPEGSSDQPMILTGTTGAGVYQTALDLDTPGFYGLLVTAELADGRTVAGTTSLQVRAEHQVPAVGDEAPNVRQATVNSEEFDFTDREIDSRAVTEGHVPDPELHDVTIESLLATDTPFAVVVSTPVFCVSRFCGPITETFEQLDTEFGDRLEFLHLEVWEDFEAQKMNGSAAKWIQTPDGSATEPWVFVVGSDGIITHRWDNVLDEAALREILQSLPPRGSPEPAGQ